MTFDDLMRERERVLGEATIDTLMTSLLLIVAQWSDDDMTNEVRLIHSRTIEELEKRVPAILPFVARYLDDESDLRYGQIVLLALEEVLDI